jgi:hypothetical protein
MAWLWKYFKLHVFTKTAHFMLEQISMKLRVTVSAIATATGLVRNRQLLNQLCNLVSCQAPWWSPVRFKPHNTRFRNLPATSVKRHTPHRVQGDPIHFLISLHILLLKMLWRIDPLLGNDSVNIFPQKRTGATGRLFLDNGSVNKPSQQQTTVFSA